MSGNYVQAPSISTQIEQINEVFLKKYIDKLKSEKIKLERQGLYSVPADEKYEIAEKLRKIFTVQRGYANFKGWESFLADEFGVKFDSLENAKSPLFSKVMNEYAKINDMFRRFRSIANQQYFNMYYGDKVADSLAYVLEVFEKNNIDIADVQEFFDDANFFPSLTAHPTNPHSVEYTKDAIDLEKKISAKENIDRALEKFIQAKISGPKKTQEHEIDEGIAYLEGIYDAIDLEYKNMQDSLDKRPKYNDIKIPDNVNKFAVWFAGDGDGNKNSTEKTLKHNVDELRKRIRRKYKDEMRSIGLDFDGFDIDASKNPQEFIDFLEAQKKFLDDKEIDNLIRKVKIFGYHFAKIDIRHTSTDIEKVASGILKYLGIIEEGETPSYEDLVRISKDPEVLLKMLALDHEKVTFSENKEEDELIKRIFGRFKIAAKNPEMFEKIIIAEFDNKAQIAALMFLLQASGNKFAEKGSHLSIVPLGESVDDLKMLPEILATILKDENYLNHIKETKKVYFMIAKSDTVRRNGVGAQIYQELAVRDSIKAILRSLIEQGVDISEIEIIPFNGNGNALQRGGGRITEIPSIYGRYVLKALADLKEEYQLQDRADILAQLDKVKIPSPCITTQGRQNDIIFEPEIVGAGTLEAFVAQSIYAQARSKNLISDNEVDNSLRKGKTDSEIRKLQKNAEKDLKKMSDAAIAQYGKHIGSEDSKTPTAIDRLFQKGSWLSAMINNKSSRVGKRGGDDASEGLQTILEAKGGGKLGANSLIKQRAITSEKNASLSGTHIISWLGWGDALEQVKNPHETYLASKSFRDYMRSASFALYMTDFEMSWRLMFDKEKPSDKDIAAGAKSYQDKMMQGKSGEITEEEALCYVEEEAFRTKKFIYQAMTGRVAEEGFDIMEKFPEIKAEIDNRKKSCNLASFVQAKMNYLANNNTSELLDGDTRWLLESCFSAYNNGNSTPLGVMNTLTKEREMEINRNKPIELFGNIENIVYPHSKTTLISADPVVGKRVRETSF